MSKTIDIADFGAVNDGSTLNTQAIQAAIDACHDAGGGRVRCGPGNYVTGSLVLKSHVELYLDAGCRLVGSTSVDDYDDFVAEGFRTELAPEKNSKSLVRAIDAEQVAIAGPGALDGSGLAFYDTDNPAGRFFRKPPTARPRLVMMLRCRDVRLESVSLLDSPCWTAWLMQCEQVRLRGLRVIGDQRMINNDGIDIDSCRDVTISDCILRTADDCIVVRAIRQMFDEPMACENVTVSNCVLDSWCQGIRVGCPGDGTIRNAVFSNITIASSNHGISFENPTRYVPTDGLTPADIHDILFTNMTINSGNRPIRLTVDDGVALTRLSDITFSHIRARGGAPCAVTGSPQTIIRNVTFDDVRIESAGEQAMECRHCEDIRFTNVDLGHRREEDVS